MKIGIFDSGLGGLLIAQVLMKELPDYDYLYLGDTANLPYGDKTQAEIYDLTVKNIDYLFKRDCQLIIVACNTASAEALRKIQQTYLVDSRPDRKVLGVIIPTVEAALAQPNVKRIGILATQATVDSHAFIREINKLNPGIVVYQQAAPGLVNAIEDNNQAKIETYLKQYLPPLIDQGIDTLILGSTHYAGLRPTIKRLFPGNLRFVAALDCLVEKLVDYLEKHQEVESRLSRQQTCELLVTAPTAATGAVTLRQSIRVI